MAIITASTETWAAGDTWAIGDSRPPPRRPGGTHPLAAPGAGPARAQPAVPAPPAVAGPRLRPLRSAGTRPRSPGGGAAMAAAAGALWAEARALLPGAEEELSLALSGEVDDCVPPLLRRARGLLYGAPGPPCGAAAAELRRLGDVLRDYAWEKLNAGPWREVGKAWRQVYAYGCLFGALAEVAACRPLAPAVRLCDMGLLMGASVLDNALARLVRLLQARLPRGKRRAAAGGSAKVRRPGAPQGPAPGAVGGGGSRGDSLMRAFLLQRARVEPPPAPVVQPEEALPHVRCPSLEHSRDNYLIPQKPVVLEGIIDHWPCMKKWR